MAEPFERENRYAILKWKDVSAALTPAELDDLRHIMWKVNDHRTARGRSPLECVVVESDWPEYEPTWAAFQARMTGKLTPSEAVFGFAGWLTSRNEQTVMSGHDDASPTVALVGRFLKANSLGDLSENWPKNLIHPAE